MNLIGETWQVMNEAFSDRRKNEQIDTGIKHQFAFSNGVIVDYRVPVSQREKLRSLYRELSRRKQAESDVEAYIQSLREQVLVQKMVNAAKAGVMFSINPSTNDDSEIMIEAAFGLGEAVVLGAVNPDLYIVDKESLKIKKKEQ